MCLTAGASGVRPTLPADPAHAPDPEARCWSGMGCRPLTRAQFDRPIAGSQSKLQEIRASTSFADLLFPKAELGSGMILMKDLSSVGRLFDISPAQTEGRPDRVIEDLHRRLMPLLRDVFPQNHSRPWIAQFFVYDRHHLGDDLQSLEGYLSPEAQGSAYSKHWMEVLREHYGDACEKDGFFLDPDSRTAWKGKVRHIRLCIWRIEQPGSIPDGQHLDDLCERLGHSLAQVGIRLTPLGSDDPLPLARQLVRAGPGGLGFPESAVGCHAACPAQGDRPGGPGASGPAPTAPRGLRPRTVAGISTAGRTAS